MNHNVQGGVCALLTGICLTIALAATALATANIQPHDVLLRASVVAVTITRAYTKIEILQEHRAAQRRAGDRANAVVTLQGSLWNALQLEGSARTDAVVEIAEGLARATDVDGALLAASLTLQEGLPALVMDRVVAMQTEMGDIPAALQTARSASTASLRAVLLAQVALGDVQAALQTATTINNRFRKDLALESIALRQARSNDLPGAIQTVGRMQDAWQNVSGLRNISRIQAQRDDIQGALQTATAMQHGLAKAWVLRDVAAAQARARQIPQAVQTAVGIDEDSLQAEALRAIAALQVKADDMAGAFKTVAIIPAISIGKAQALRDMAAAQAQRGDVTGALHTAASITHDDECTQSWALRDIAVAQATAGNIQRGLQTVTMIQDAHVDHFFRGAAIRWVMAAQARQGQLDAALAWADQQMSPILKAFSLLGVAEGMLERQGAGKLRDNICRKALVYEWVSPFIMC